MLAVACPEIEPEELAALTIGQRDARLLILRERTFGAALNCAARCPQCAERLDFALTVPELLGDAPAREQEPTWEMAIADLHVRGRLPDSGDLAAVAGCGNVTTTRRLLMQRCVLEATQDGQPVAAREWPAELIADMARRMVDADPLAEILLDVVCPACQRRGPLLFDIVSFFWAEIDAQAKRLLHEVHLLARAYGWREADILTMSARRRQRYLEMVSS
jgi:hypothetical protein